jgi:hypothetical protein
MEFESSEIPPIAACLASAAMLFDQSSFATASPILLSSVALMTIVCIGVLALP